MFCIAEQANKWLKNVEKANGLRVIQYTDENYLDVLADSISKGIPVLLENMRRNIRFNVHFINGIPHLKLTFLA